MVDGDSLSATSNIPYSPLISLPSNWQSYNVAIAGTQLSDMLANETADVLSKRVAGKPFIVSILGGTNDCVTGKPNSTSIANLLSYAANVHGVGGKINVLTLPSLENFETCREGLNTLIVSNAASFDALTRIDLNANVGADGAWANTTYFSDGRHWTSLAVNTIVAPLVQTQINSLIP